MKLEGLGLWHLVFSFIEWTFNKIGHIIALSQKCPCPRGHLFYLDSYGEKL